MWCQECHGQGGWEESGEEVDFGDPEWVECPKCDGTGEAPAPTQAQDAEEIAFDGALRKALEPRSCRLCGCTDEDCRGCIERTGAPCSWVAEDLCSACQA